MRIAINTKDFLNNHSANANLFIDECFEQIVKQYSNHHFIFIAHKQSNKALASLKNVTLLSNDTELKTSLSAQLWYNYKLPTLLKKNKADILINTEGACSLRTKTPQLLIVQNLLFLDYPQFVSKKYLQFYKKNTLPFLNKAITVLTISQSLKNDISENYKVDKNKIDVLYPAISKLFKPIDWKEKEAIKAKYTEGKEFFLFNGSIDAISNLINLLKAFSFFKKRLKSNMQLVIATNDTSNNESFSKNLETYKFRNEVKLLKNLSQDELAKITATAYAFVYPSYFEESTALLQAVKCEVPIITSETIFFNEICAGAALYVMPNKYEDIADKMMLLFKDEKKRTELIEEGKQVSAKYTIEKTIEILWRSIMKTVE